MRQSFYLALSFLTRIPTPDFQQPSDASIGRSVLFYPLVGLIIGLALIFPALVFPTASSLLIAALTVVIWAAITGGLHLDGVGDSADAWLGGVDEEKTHKILKDPLVGSAAVIAMVAILMLKFAALAVLLEQASLWVIVAAPIVARGSVLLLFLTTPYLRNEGMAKIIANHMPTDQAWPVLIGCVLLAVFVSIPGLAFMLVIFWLLRRLMMQRLRGFTGDTAGASIEFGEGFWLVGAALSL